MAASTRATGIQAPQQQLRTCGAQTCERRSVLARTKYDPRLTTPPAELASYLQSCHWTTAAVLVQEQCGQQFYVWLNAVAVQ